MSPANPLVILAGIKQFGLAPDGADLRDLAAAIERMEQERDKWKFGFAEQVREGLKAVAEAKRQRDLAKADCEAYRTYTKTVDEKADALSLEVGRLRNELHLAQVQVENCVHQYRNENERLSEALKNCRSHLHSLPRSKTADAIDKVIRNVLTGGAE